MTQRTSIRGIPIRAVLVALLVAGGDAASAQDVTHIPGTPTCSECELRATRRLVLGTFDGDAALVGEPSGAAKDSEGTFYVSEFANGGPPLVFDSSGRFVRRMARKGRGPGELMWGVAVFIAPGDSVHVIDLGTGRRSIFSAAGEFGRMVPQPGIGRFGLILRNGVLVLNRRDWDPVLIGTPLHLIDREGKVIHSFGGNYPVLPGDDLSHLGRVVGPGRAGGFWAAHRVEYEFSLWSATGGLVRHYTRENDFYRPSERFEYRLSPRAPPRTSTIREDSSGLVWISIQVPVPAAEWEAGLGEPEVNWKGIALYPQAMTGRLFHTIIEVIDPQAGRLLVSRRLPFHAIAATDDGEYAAYRQDEEGVPYVDIWRVQLVQP